MQYPESKFNLMQTLPLLDQSRGLYSVNDMSLLSGTQQQLAFGMQPQPMLFNPQSSSSFVYPAFPNIAAQTLGLYSVASMPGSSPQMSLTPAAKATPSFMNQTIEFSVYAKTSNRHWGPRYIRVFVDAQTCRQDLNHILFQSVALDNCSSATLHGNAVSGKATLLSALLSVPADVISAATVAPVTPASTNSSSASVHDGPAETQSSAAPLQLHFSLPDAVKPCTCIGCPNLFSKVSSRRSCDICHEDGHVVEASRVVLVKFPPALPIKLIKTSALAIRAALLGPKRPDAAQNPEVTASSPTASAPSPQISALPESSNTTTSEGAELLSMLGRYAHWKFEALPPASESRKKRREEVTESKEAQELFLVFASSSVSREFVAELSSLSNVSVTHREGFDHILFGSGGISIQTLSPDTYTRIKMRNLSHFWRLEIQTKMEEGRTKELLFTKIGKQNQNRDRKARSQPPSPRESNSGSEGPSAPKPTPKPKPRARANSASGRTKTDAVQAASKGTPSTKGRTSKTPSRSKPKADTSSVGSSDSDMKAPSATSSGGSQPPTPFNATLSALFPPRPSLPLPMPLPQQQVPLPLPQQQLPLFSHAQMMGLPPLPPASVPSFTSFPIGASVGAASSLAMPAMPQVPALSPTNSLDFSLNVHGVDVPASQLLQFLLARASQPTIPSAAPSPLASPFAAMSASSLNAAAFPLQRGLSAPLVPSTVSISSAVHAPAPQQVPAPPMASSSSAFLSSRASNAQTSAFAPVSGDPAHHPSAPAQKRTATQSAESGLSPTTVATNASDSPSGSVVSGSSLDSSNRSQKRRAVPAISTRHYPMPERVPANHPQESESPLTGNSASASDHARALLSLASSSSASKLALPHHRRDDSAVSLASSTLSVPHSGSAHRHQAGDAVRSNRTPGQRPQKPRKTRREPGHWVLTVTEAPATPTAPAAAERTQVEGGVDIAKLESKNRWMFFSRFSFHPLLLLMELVIAGFCLFLIINTLSVNSRNYHRQNHNLYLSQAHKALVDATPNWGDPNFLSESPNTRGFAASTSYTQEEDGTTAANTLYSEINKDSSWSLVRPFHNIERVQESVNMIDENAKDILTAIRGVSWVFRTFLRCFNVTTESLSFRETRTRLGLLQRGVEALRSGEGLSDLLDGFIDLNGNFTDIGGFQAWAGPQCDLLNNPVTLSVMVSTCAQVDYVNRPLPDILQQSVGTFDSSLACPNVSKEYVYPTDEYNERAVLNPFHIPASATRRRLNRRMGRVTSSRSSTETFRKLDSEDDWEDDTYQDEHQDYPEQNDAFAEAEARYLGPALGFYNSSARCAAGVALLLKRFSFSKHDDLAYSPPQSVVFQRIRSWTEQLRLESSGLHVPLAMLSMLDRQGPRGVLVDTRDWEVNGTLLIALSFGAYGCHLLLTFLAAGANSAWKKSEPMRIAVMQYVRGRKIADDESLPPSKHETGLDNAVLTPTPGQPPSETRDDFDTSADQDDLSDSGDLSRDHTPLPARPSSSVQMSSVVARRESSADPVCI